MYNMGWWDFFTNYGSVELYMLYKLMEKNQEEQNGGVKDRGTDTFGDKFE